MEALFGALAVFIVVETISLFVAIKTRPEVIGTTALAVFVAAWWTADNPGRSILTYVLFVFAVSGLALIVRAAYRLLRVAGDKLQIEVLREVAGRR
jgi:hypothetical protein